MSARELLVESQSIFGGTDEWHLTCAHCDRKIFDGEIAVVVETPTEYIGAACLSCCNWEER